MKTFTRSFRMQAADLAGLLLIVVCAAIIGLALIVTGCSSANPAAVQDPKSGVWSAPPYIPDPRLAAASNTVATIAGAIAPANPYAGITDFAYKALFGLAGGLSLAFVNNRNKSATIGTMAAGVVKAGAGPQVLNHASSTAQFSPVAAAINAATGANQGHAGI